MLSGTLDPERRDRALGQQLRRSGSSVPLNIGEAEYSDPGNRRARLFTAAGSANESRVTLKVAIGWGHVEAERAAAALAIADRLMAMLYRLLHGR